MKNSGRSCLPPLTILWVGCFFWAALQLAPHLMAAPGDIDLSFTNGTGANAVIFATKVRTNDNKI